MLVHIKGSQVRPEPVLLDERYQGQAVSAYGTLWGSPEQALEVGIWEFEGDQLAPPTRGLAVVIVLLSGTLELGCDGEHCVLEPGDVAIYDCSGEGRHFRSAGARAAYIIHHRRNEHTA